jgi:hypothetical protein
VVERYTQRAQRAVTYEKIPSMKAAIRTDDRHSNHRYSNLTCSILATMVTASAVMSGCAGLKFYPGEERADSEIGRLLFNSEGASMNVVTLDGVQHPHPGRTLEILPGPHTLVVKYAQTFTDSGAPLHRDPSGKTVPLTRYGTCSIRFTIEAAQELFVFVDAVTDAGLTTSAPPMITLRQTGYEQPALFQERCKEESKAQLKEL